MRVVWLYAKDEGYRSAFRQVWRTRDIRIGVRVELQQNGLEMADEVFGTTMCCHDVYGISMRWELKYAFEDGWVGRPAASWRGW
jgi:hypothetical protein